MNGRMKRWGALSIPSGLLPVNRKLPTGVGFQGGCSIAEQARIMALPSDKSSDC